MPQYWLKPEGVTRDPYELVPRDFLATANRDEFRVMVGPPTRSNPPKMGRLDRVLLHAVGYVRLIGEVEILNSPDWESDPVWGLRWPWVYRARIDVWVDDVEAAPKSRGLVPDRAIRRIQAGGTYSKLSRAEYEAARDVLRAWPAAHVRSSA